MKELLLHTGKHTSTIRIGRGLLSELDSLGEQKLILLVDENVYRIYNNSFTGKNCIIIPAGEKHKSLGFAEEVFRKMVQFEVDRSSFLVGIGGGLVSDIAGFVASVFMRGIPFGFISTTLLGQVDASIGGKNGVNLDGYKNMIGVIRQPVFVWCDLDLLESLEHRELTSGFSEVIKYGAIRDAGLFSYLEKNYSVILNKQSLELEQVVYASAAIKISIVEEDETELGNRKLLNFGHTLGHAIEKLSGVYHGEAVSAGMVLAADLSVKLKFLQTTEADRLKQLISLSGLPVSSGIMPEELFDTLLKDKKRSGSFLDFILLRQIGEAFIYRLDLDELKPLLHDLY